MRISRASAKYIGHFTPEVIAEFEKQGVRIMVDNRSLTVEFESDDPYVEMKAESVIEAIAEGGVPPRVAFRLFGDDVMKKIDLSEILGSAKDLRRVLGRIIGTKGRMKTFMEEITETNIFVIDDKIYIIGAVEGVELASQAIDALIRGSPHKKVYRLLEAGRRTIREEKLKLWKEY